MGAAESKLWNTELIQKYDLSGPRYTSYPTALQFHNHVGMEQWHQAIAKSNQHGGPLSLYFHIPFCDTVCYYCACNRIITANKNAAKPYVNNLLIEIEAQADAVDRNRQVEHIHWGGGTPTFMCDEDIAKIMATIRQNFYVLTDDAAEVSIEIHPASVDSKRITTLRRLGFNRLSMGIQDFDPAVQTAVNRFNSVAEVERLVRAARNAHYRSISMDLIYGLPRQSPDSFAYTVEKIIGLDPDRVSLFNYAHMPHLFKTQKQINVDELPESQVKLEILHQSIEQLLAAGYVYIGMDHFAKPDDELAIAQQSGELQRNFQGYSTHKNCDLLAFGVSSISAIGDTIFQNTKTLATYYSLLSLGKIPIERGITLDSDDILRKAVISDIICHFSCDFRAIEKKFDIVFHDYFSEELHHLKIMQNDGLLTLEPHGLSVLPSGRLLVRRICMVFDRYLQQESQLQQRYSRII